MAAPKIKRHTLGFISSWHIYEGTTIDPYAHAVLQGLRAAAVQRDVNLLLACGIGPLAGGSVSRPAWPQFSPASDFVPVGPWNVDGLIVSPHRLTGEQTQYVQDLIEDGFPVVFSTTDLPGPAVAQDNFSGIQQAMAHLMGHGHRQIAFIAGVNLPSRDVTIAFGDNDERKHAYIGMLKTAGIDYDPRLLAYGDCTFIGGRQAMNEILATGAPFTAVVANNDRSGFGAVRALQDANRRVPEDVAVIGYDNILESRAQTPAFSTVHNFTFTLGNRLIDYLIERIESGHSNLPVQRVPVHLVIRQSCGCLPRQEAGLPHALPADQPAINNRLFCNRALAHLMLEAALNETQHITQGQGELICSELVYQYVRGLEEKEFSSFDQAITQMLKQLDQLDEDALAWQNAIAILQKHVVHLLSKPVSPEASHRALEVLDQVQLKLNEHSRFQSARKLFQHMNMSDRLTMLTAQLQSVQEEREIAAMLREHLEPIGLRRVAAILFEPDGVDPVGQSRVLFHVGEGARNTGVGARADEERFSTRQFASQETVPFQLALLPLVVSEQIRGYVVFDADNLEPCGSVVRNLASALHNLGLYRQAVESRQLAEEASQLKSRFLSMVSHELRTPLNLIVGLSEMVLRQRNQIPVPTEAMWQDMERIFNSAQHLGWLIGDVLDLASSEAGQLRLNHEALDLTEVLQVVKVTGEQLARGKNLGWEAQLPSGGPWVMGDRTRLRQVALNLINNAVKFTEHGKISLAVTTRGDQVVVAISDTGLGVSVEDQDEIFNDFRRSEVVVKRGYGGMGLGLAISKQLIELQQGSIGFYSSGIEGKGSTFFFTLPVLQTQAPVESDSGQSSQNLIIAFLTEQEEIPEALVDQLTQDGFKVIMYPVNRDPIWLPKLLVSRPDVLIMDERLANQQGWEIARVLKRHSHTEKIPVLVYSYNVVDDRGALLELSYLQKPLSPENLAEMLYNRGLLVREDSSIRTILIVDDEAGLLEFNSRLIQQQVINCQVLTARNGREALKIIRDQHPNLVLLDLIMPEIDGFGVLEAIREDEQTRNIPVVILTGKSLNERDLERLNQGVSAILNKGMFNSRETIEHIENALVKSHILGSTAQKMARKAVIFMHMHYAEPITREQIAEYIGINPDYLTVCFNHELRIPPMTYLNRYRINRARVLLETENKKITEIAMDVGFSDSAHFSRMFLRETGVSPRAYQHGARAHQLSERNPK